MSRKPNPNPFDQRLFCYWYCLVNLNTNVYTYLDGYFSLCWIRQKKLLMVSYWQFFGMCSIFLWWVYRIQNFMLFTGGRDRVSVEYSAISYSRFTWLYRTRGLSSRVIISLLLVFDSHFYNDINTALFDKLFHFHKHKLITSATMY